uniref:Sec-3 protein n=1 Tax=Fopius arisanus TaxID=64838 RepID=A0A0C9PQ52_9HYME
MYSHRQYYFSRFAKSHPILKFVNIYDRQSFIREWIFDNIYVCILTYVVFFGALWYASKIIKRIEESNERMLEVVAENREKLDDVMALRNKRQEYEEVVMKVKGAQRVTSKHLETEIEKLQSECSETTERLTELEKLLDKKWRGRTIGVSRGFREDQCFEEDIKTESSEGTKVLEPSFPPRTPPKKKYGMFVSRQTKR